MDTPEQFELLDLVTRYRSENVQEMLPKPMKIKTHRHDTGSHLYVTMHVEGLEEIRVLTVDKWYGDYSSGQPTGFNPEVEEWCKPILQQLLIDLRAWKERDIAYEKEQARRVEEEKAFRRSQILAHYRTLVNDSLSLTKKPNDTVQK